jgi:hypothetical protein
VNTDDLIRATLARQADLAPPPGPVLAALRRPKRNRKPLFLVIGATVTAAAALVASVLIPTGHQADAPPAETVNTTPAPAGPPPVAMGYTVTWLPDGFTERWRGISWDERPMQERRWAQGEADVTAPITWPSVVLTIEPLSHNTGVADQIAAAPAVNRVSVNGAQGMYVGQSDLPSTVLWLLSADQFASVNVSGIPDQRQTSLRIAESVRPDSAAAVRPVVRMGSDYRGADTMYQVKGTSPNDWSGVLSGGGATKPFNVELSTRPITGTGGTPITARGRPAFYRKGIARNTTTSTDTGLVEVDLGGSRYLTVSGNLTAEELTAIANAVVVDPNPDVSWLGTS